MISSTISILAMALILDCTRVALFAFARNWSTNFYMCAFSASCFSRSLICCLVYSAFVFSYVLKSPL